jgi:hypothetical protein
LISRSAAETCPTCYLQISELAENSRKPLRERLLACASDLRGIPDIIPSAFMRPWLNKQLARATRSS